MFPVTRERALELDAAGLTVYVLHEDNTCLLYTSVEIPAIGTYMVTNALAAAAAGKLLGLTDEEIANGVASYKTVGLSLIHI